MEFFFGGGGWMKCSMKKFFSHILGKKLLYMFYFVYADISLKSYSLPPSRSYFWVLYIPLPISIKIIELIRKLWKIWNLLKASCIYTWTLLHVYLLYVDYIVYCKWRFGRSMRRVVKWVSSDNNSIKCSAVLFYGNHVFQVKYTGGARGGQPERERTRVGHYLKKECHSGTSFNWRKSD